MTGSLQTKGNRYYIVVDIPCETGRKQKWLSTGLLSGKDKTEAEQLLKRVLQSGVPRIIRDSPDMLFSDAVRMWLGECSQTVDQITVQGYRILADRHILPWFDALAIPLRDIDRDILQRYVDEKSADGRLDGSGGLSASSIKRHKNILHQTLNRAVRIGLIDINPCQMIRIPRNDPFEPTFYSTERLTELLAAFENDPLFPVIKLTVTYGLRRSEVLGLKWDSIDFESDLLSIKHTVVKVTSVVRKDKTKSAGSRRTFPLISDIRDMLLDIRNTENINRGKYGDAYNDNDYILKWPDGTPYSPDWVSHRFKRMLEVYRLPHIRFHELRHSCASFLLSQGFTLKDVQEWLGHADISTTANTYGHLDQERKKAIAGKISSTILNPESDKQLPSNS